MSALSPFSTNALFTAPAAADGISITPNSSAWTDSSWVTLIASTDAAWILTGLTVIPDDLGLGVSFEIDVGVGGAGSEVMVTTFAGTFANTHFSSPGILPAPIPLDNIGEGARVALRLRKSNTNTTPWMFAAQFYKKPLVGELLTTAQPQKVYPPAADNVLLTNGAGIWTSSTYTELVSATSADIVVVGIIIDILSLNSGWEVDIGVGPALAEVVIQTVRAYHTGIQFTDGPNLVTFRRPIDNISAGSRIALRTRSQVITGSRDLSVALVYIEKPL